MTPRQVPAQTAAAPEGRLFPLLGAALGLALLLASLWAAAAYRRALGAEGGPLDPGPAELGPVELGPVELGPAEALDAGGASPGVGDPAGRPEEPGAPGIREPRAGGLPAGAVEPEPQVE